MVYKLRKTGVPGIRIEQKKNYFNKAWKEQMMNDLLNNTTHRGIDNYQVPARITQEIFNTITQKNNSKILVLGSGQGNLDKDIMEITKKHKTHAKVTSISLTNPFPGKKDNIIERDYLTETRKKTLQKYYLLPQGIEKEKTKQEINKITKEIISISQEIRKSVHERKKELQEKGIKWINSPVEKLKYAKNNKFNCIISSFGALTYSPIKTKLFYQQLKLLAPKGKLIIINNAAVQLYFPEIKGFNKEKIESHAVIYTKE